jgi:hypothetical protein
VSGYLLSQDDPAFWLAEGLSTSQCWAVVLLLARPESYRKDAELANSVPEGKQEQEEGGLTDRRTGWRCLASVTVWL